MLIACPVEKEHGIKPCQWQRDVVKDTGRVSHICWTCGKFYRERKEPDGKEKERPG